MNDSPQTSVSTFSISASAYQIFTAIRKPVLKLSIVSIFLPLITLETLLSKPGESTAAALKAITSEILTNKLPANYALLIEAASLFFTPWFLSILLLSLIFFSSYMGMIRLSLAYKAQESLPSATSAFMWGLRQFFPKGLFLIVIYLILSLERYMWGPFRVFSMFIMMAPVLFAAEGGRLRSSIHRSLFLRYVNPSASTAFNTALTLIVFGALVFFMETMIVMGWKSLLNLDQWMGIGREFWTLRFFDFPFSVIFLLSNALSAFAYSFVFIALPLFTVELYARTASKTLP